MTEKLFDAIPIAYRGLYADAHLVDAQQFGQSIASAAQIANSICHQFFFEGVERNPPTYPIRFCVGTSRENGLIQELFAVMSAAQLPVFAPILIKTGKLFIERAFDAIVATILKKKSETNNAVDKIYDLAVKHNEFATQVHHGHMRDKKWLQGQIERMANQNRTALRQLPAPVGRTVRLMQIGSDPASPIIDEPSAEVLRSHTLMEVGDATEYEVRILGVFKTNHTSRVMLLSEGDKVVPGKIIDPVVDQTNNVYTKALNEDAPLRVIAKPILKDGKLQKLYISDAKIIRRPRKPRKKKAS